MRSTFFFLFAWCALLLGATLPARAQRAVWQQSLVGGEDGSDRQVLATDAAGNSYVTGGYSDTLRVPGLKIGATPRRRWDGYLVKYNAFGQRLWLQHFGGAEEEVPFAIAVDAAQNAVYTTGQHGRACRWDATHILDSAGTYLARLDATTGAVQWVRNLQEATAQHPGAGFHSLLLQSIAVAPDHSLYLAGIGANLDSLDAVPLRNGWTNANSGLVAHCTPAGIFTDAFEMSGGSGSTISRVQIAPNGDLVMAGSVSGTVQIGYAPGSPVLSTPPSPPIDASFRFIARVTPAGTTSWARLISSQSYADVLGLALDAQGNCYAAGRGYAPVTVDQTVAADTGQYLVKLDPQGAVQWLKTFPGNQKNNYVASLIVGPDGLLYSTGTFYSLRAGTTSATFDTFTLPTYGRTSLFVLCQTPTDGTVRWAKTRDSYVGPTANNSGGGLQADAQSNLYLLGWNDGPGTYDGNEVGWNATFLLRLEPSAFLGGQVYLDANGNGQRDPGEGAFPRPVMVREGQRAEVYGTGPQGFFNAFVAPGPYGLSVAGVPAYYTRIAPATGTHQGNIINNGQRITNLDFGLTPIVNQQDLRVTLTPFSRARPGQLITYRVRVENVGTTTITGGQVRVTLDTLTTLVGTIPAATPAGPHTRTWALPSLAAFGIRDYDVVFTFPVTTPLGAVLRARASVTPLAGDLNPADNTDELRQTVSNSADPNQITVNHSQLTPQQVAAGQPLDYTIEFENFGNDTAYAVMIQDTLPAGLLQLGTMRLVSQSHNCQWLVSGRVLKVTFPGIVLPHRAVDALRSKGFVRFRVTPNTTLGVGTLIPNTAHITFDFNLPVTTNEATTLVQTPNGLVAAESGAATWSLYPNPADRTDLVTIAVPALKGRAREAAATVAVLDALGRIATTAHLAPDATNVDLDVRGLAPGLYVVRLTAADGTATSRRLVVR